MRRPCAPLTALLVVLGTYVLGVSHVGGQDTAVIADEPTASDAKTDAVTLKKLVAALEDSGKREELIRQLEAMLAALEPAEESKTPGLLQTITLFLTQVSNEASQTSVQLVDQLQTLPTRLRAFGNRLRDPEERATIGWDALALSAIVLGALFLAFLIWLPTRRPREMLTREPEIARNLLHRLWRLLVVFLLELIPPFVILVVVFGGLAIVPTTATGTAIAIAIVSAIAVKRVALAVIHFILSPGSSLRLLPLSDEFVGALTGSLSRFLTLIVYGYFFLEGIHAAGAEEALLEPLRNVYGLTMLFYGVTIILRYRRFSGPVTQATDSASPVSPPADPAELSSSSPAWSSFVRTCASLWWMVAVVYILGLYLVWVSPVEGGLRLALTATALSVLVIAAAASALLLLRRLITGLGRWIDSLVQGMPGLTKKVPKYTRTLQIIATAAVALVAGGFVLESWGLAALDTMTYPAVRSALGTTIEVFLTIMIALAVVDVASAVTQTYLSRREKSGRASAKTKTLVPLAHKAIKVVVSIFAFVMILGELGVNIAPILAGVGVLGLAIGFGAQTLVKDIITGVFMLMEDSVSVGDVVSLDGTGGLVEAINIRTVRLRDLAGNVHLIPYSSVSKVTNMTKEYSRYVIEAGVAYREDVDEVIQLLKQLGDEMREDPTWARDIIEPIEILGLDRFEDSAVVVRARLTTKPIRQWAVGREFNRRMKKAFDERGIEIPFPHRTIYLGVEKDGTAPPLHVTQKPVTVTSEHG